MHRFNVSIEVLVPILADDDDEAIEDALELLESCLPAGVKINEGSAAIAEDSRDDDD